MDTHEVERLKKLVGLFDFANEGERANAVSMAART